MPTLAPAFPCSALPSWGQTNGTGKWKNTVLIPSPACCPCSTSLRRRPSPKAVATSSSAKQAAETLEAGGLADRFAHLVTSDQVALGKPAPDLYLEAARRLDMPPAACIALEDSEAGVQSAHTAGMTVLMVPDLKKPSPQAKASSVQNPALAASGRSFDCRLAGALIRARWDAWP